MGNQTLGRGRVNKTLMRADSVESRAMLDRRAQMLLKALVERYIAEGEPVGSRALSRYSGLDLSPATIRNVMADLEQLGFVASPHTSSGRVPRRYGGLQRSRAAR